MLFFKCEYCSKQFDRKYNLLRHYNKKLKCNLIAQIVTLKEIDCKKYYSNNNSNDELIDELNNELLNTNSNTNSNTADNELIDELNNELLNTNSNANSNTADNELIDELNNELLNTNSNANSNDELIDELNNELVNTNSNANSNTANIELNNEFNNELHNELNKPFLKIPNLQKVTFEETCDFVNKPVIKFKKEDAIKLIKFNPNPKFTDTDNRKTKMRNYANKKNKTSKNYSHHIQVRDNNRNKYNLLQEQKEAKRIADIDAKYDEMMRQDALEEEQYKIRQEQLKKERTAIKQIKQNEPRRPRLSRRSYDNFLM
jgi:hypothetical protein